jgi:hypothetical protein
MKEEELLRSGKLCGHLVKAGVDAVPVKDDQGNHTRFFAKSTISHLTGGPWATRRRACPIL